MQKLTTGDDFPNLTLNLTDGGTLELPGISTPTSRSCCSIEATGDPTASGFWLDTESAVPRSQNRMSAYLPLPLIRRNKL